MVVLRFIMYMSIYIISTIGWYSKSNFTRCFSPLLTYIHYVIHRTFVTLGENVIHKKSSVLVFHFPRVVVLVYHRILKSLMKGIVKQFLIPKLRPFSRKFYKFVFIYSKKRQSNVNIPFKKIALRSFNIYIVQQKLWNVHWRNLSTYKMININ